MAHGLGLAPERLRYHEHAHGELAHYARAAFDIEFDFGGTLGFQEIEGIHNRGDFDLGRHQEYSGKKLEYFDQPKNKRYMPFVIETSVGAEPHAARAARERVSRREGRGRGRRPRRARAASVARADQGGGVRARRRRTACRRSPTSSRTSCASSFPVVYDETGSIGRRYRRQDEVGTPFCITVDGRTVKDGTVTCATATR